MGASPVSSAQVSPEPSRRPSAQSGEHPGKISHPVSHLP